MGSKWWGGKCLKLRWVNRCVVVLARYGQCKPSGNNVNRQGGVRQAFLVDQKLLLFIILRHAAMSFLSLVPERPVTA
jgi:hypothetical protein